MTVLTAVSRAKLNDARSVCRTRFGDTFGDILW